MISVSVPGPHRRSLLCCGRSNAGCVAVEKTKFVSQSSASSFIMSSSGPSSLRGSVCTSSRITMERAMLCTRRKSEGRFENRLSKNRTDVVTISGASQFSVSGRKPVSWNFFSSSSSLSDAGMKWSSSCFSTSF